MRSISKLLSAISILAAFMATTAFADDMCYELCMSCRGAERAANCDKIESTCNCPFVIDSAKSKNMGVEIGKRRLIEDISIGCSKPVCVRTLTFEDGMYKSMEKGRTNLTHLELITRKDESEQRFARMQPQAIKAANRTVDSLTGLRSILPIPPMTMECTDKCNACFGPKVPDTLAVTPAQPALVQPAVDSAAAPADSNTANAAATDMLTQLSAAPTDTAVATPAPVDSATIPQANTDSIARTDSLDKADSTYKACFVTESTCQCKAHTDNTRELIELDKIIAIKSAYADSLLKFKTVLLREDMARALADSVQAKCHIDGKCRYTVTYTNNELALLEMYPFVEQLEPAPITPAEAAPAPVQPVPEIIVEKACPQPAPADTAEKKEDKKDERIFYKVMELVYGNYRENNYYTTDYGRIGPLDDEKGYEAGLTYLLRWYFYDAGAISIGLGTFYHFKKFNYDIPDDDGFSIYYHNIGADIPISFRFGIPKIPIFKPFISQTFHFHKPIFEVYKIDGLEPEEGYSDDQTMEETAKTFLHLAVFDGVKTRVNGLYDFTFSVWLGFGLQITRHFSAEYQICFGTAVNRHSHEFESDDYWRVVVGFAW